MNRASRGALLLEVLIVAIVFTFLVSAAAATASYHERALRVHQDRNSATFLAEQEMERLVAEGFVLLPQAAAAYPQDLVVRRFVDGQTVESTYTCRVEVTESPGRELRHVLVEVTYPQQDGERAVRLETDVFWSN